MSQTTNHGFAAVAGVALCAFAPLASATTFPATVFTFNAANSNGVGSYSIMLTDPDVFFDGQEVYWQAANNITIWDNTNTFQLGTISAGTTVNMGVIGGVSFIDFNFSLFGDDNADTTFSLFSGDLAGLGYTAATLQASGTMLVGDSNNNGAEVRGLQAGGRFLDVMVNGSTFASMIDGSIPSDPDVGNITVGPTQTIGDAEGFGPVFAGAVGSIELHYLFEVTAGDQAGGTSTILVVPAPAAAALLGLGGLIATRRRRG